MSDIHNTHFLANVARYKDSLDTLSTQIQERVNTITSLKTENVSNELRRSPRIREQTLFRIKELHNEIQQKQQQIQTIIAEIGIQDIANTMREDAAIILMNIVNSNNTEQILELNKMIIENSLVSIQDITPETYGPTLNEILGNATGGPTAAVNGLNHVKTAAINNALISNSLAVSEYNKDKINEYIKKHSTPRKLLGDISTASQCLRTIGEAFCDPASYNLLRNGVNPQGEELIRTSRILNVLDPKDRRYRTSRCWLCGLPLGPRDGPIELRPQCEHILPVALAATYFGIDSSQHPYLADYLDKNYAWAHASCNAYDKAHFDANTINPLVIYDEENQELIPQEKTYARIVNGWGNNTGIKNRLRNITILGNLTAIELETWAKFRIDTIYDTYVSLTSEIYKNLKVAPNIYALGLVATYSENITKYVDDAIEAINEIKVINGKPGTSASHGGIGGKRKSIKKRKRKNSRRKRKKSRRKRKIIKTRRKSIKIN